MKSEHLTKINIGSVVALNSEGPLMTVTGWEDGSLSMPEAAKRSMNDPALRSDIEAEDFVVHTAWHDKRGQLHEASFPAACLRLRSEAA